MDICTNGYLFKVNNLKKRFHMKAVILEKINEPLIVEEIKLTPLNVGQVLVKNIVSGLCGSQLLEIGGYKGNTKFVPHLLGHEGCGIVQETGLGVTRVKPGNKVVLHWMKTEGIESPFPNYKYKEKMITSGKVTTLSEYSIVSENRMTVVPDDTDPELCALLGCSLTTALGTINNEANVKLGESVMIIRCGGVGTNLIQGARLVGAFPIIACDEHENKATLCIKDLGADVFINPKKSISADAINALCPKGIDIIIDTTGDSDIISVSLQFLADNGRYIMIGHPSPDRKVYIDGHSFFGMKGRTLKTTVGGKTNPAEDIPRYVKLHKAGLLKINNIITHHYNIDNINEAVNTLKEGNCGRIIINL